MNDRVARLHTESVDTKPYISSQRAELVTQFYQSDVAGTVSKPVFRAMVFKHLMENKTIYIGAEELIVGERGPAPKATPTYPELCCHTIADFEVLSTRERTPFDVDDQVREVYERDIIPYWQGRTIREKLFDLMTEPWQDAFDAGVFTEFMEQRAFGHAILDDKIYHRGFLDFKERIRQLASELDYVADPRAYEKAEEYKAMEIVCDAIIVFAKRHAKLAVEMAEQTDDENRRRELLRIAEVCDRVPAKPPRDFQEALQMYWFVHLGVITELNTWDSFNPGRLDQHLFPFFERDLAEQTLTHAQAEELLQCFWVKFNNQPAPPKVGVTEEQSGTYTDFALINIGGLTPSGADAVNEVSYMLLNVVEEMQLVQPSACIQLSKKNPDRFLKRACRVIRTGLGQPSIFNTDVIVQEMLHDGKSYEDARVGGPSGCVTISAFGKESCTLTGYCNWPKIFELALNDGVDPATGKQLGPQTGDAAEFEEFEQIVQAYQTQLKHFIDIKIAGNNVIERLYANELPAPFMSVIMDDCIERGRDYHDGGARYNPTYIQGVGLGTLVDSLAAIRHEVFERQSISMSQLIDALKNDFAENEPLRMRLANKSPKYGNDDPQADDLAKTAFKSYFDVLDGRPNTKGGKYRVNLLPTTVHIYFGTVTGALPNGRKAGETLSEGISPTQGADTEGPTAVLKSAACIDHARTGGTLLNMKFTPQMLEGEGLDRLADLVRTYFTMDGHHIQFNVFDVETLRAAQQNPQDYRNLVVRVAGYSDYFVDVGSELQEEIIARTEQKVL